MSTLKVLSLSMIDLNLEDEWDSVTCQINEWLEFVQDMPGVVDAEWCELVDARSSYTLITFESEAHKNWFIMRWG